jgi:hypothetical protein
MMIIDPPSPFASKDEWQKFLIEMQGVLRDHPNDESVKEAIELAQEQLR